MDRGLCKTNAAIIFCATSCNMLVNIIKCNGLMILTLPSGAGNLPVAMNSRLTSVAGTDTTEGARGTRKSGTSASWRAGHAMSRSWPKTKNYKSWNPRGIN